MDRHLNGLKLIAAEIGMETPPLFKDVAYTRSVSHILFTSNVRIVVKALIAYITGHTDKNFIRSEAKYFWGALCSKHFGYRNNYDHVFPVSCPLVRMRFPVSRPLSRMRFPVSRPLSRMRFPVSRPLSHMRDTH